MPRAFLIKAKKEKKKEDEQASQAEHQHGQFSNEVAGECKRLDVAKIYRANFFEIFSFNSKSRCSGSFESRGCVITLGLFARRIFSNFCKLEQVCAGIELFCLNLALKLTYQNSNLGKVSLFYLQFSKKDISAKYFKICTAFHRYNLLREFVSI